MIQGVCAAHLQVSARVSARAVAEMRRYLDQASRPSGRFHPVTPATAAKVREAGQATGQQAREKGDEQTPTPGAAPGLRPPRRRSGRRTADELDCSPASQPRCRAEGFRAHQRAERNPERRQFDMRMTQPPGMVNTSWCRDKVVNVIMRATEVTNVECT